MFGITPRLDVDKVVATLFSDPSQSMRIIQAWLEGYREVTAEKDHEGDRAYRQKCMLWAEQLSAVITAMIFTPGQHFSQLSPQPKQLIKKFYELINQFLLAQDFPEKPSSKASKFFQGILSALSVIPEVQQYESIYFLEDLEVLRTAFKAHFFFYENENENENGECKLQYQENTVILSFEALKQSKIFRPLINNFLYPLMQIAIQVSPERLAQLKRLHLDIPRQIEYSATSSVFASLFQLFEEISKDLVPQEDKEFIGHVTQLFQKWRKEERDLTEFFDGDFGAEDDNLLLILSSRFTKSIARRVSEFVAEYPRPLVSPGFFASVSELTTQYPLDRVVKIGFNVEIFKLNVINALFFGEGLKDAAAALMKKVVFTQEELLMLCRDRETLLPNEQLVFLYAVYVKLYEIFSSSDYNLFIDFISEQDGLLDLCIQHVELSLREPLFTQVITTLIGLQESPDLAVREKLRERYAQAGIIYPWGTSSNEVVLYKLTHKQASVLPQAPGGSVQVGELFPVVVPASTTTIEQTPFGKFGITAF